jgi:hypothetical protein
VHHLLIEQMLLATMCSPDLFCCTIGSHSHLSVRCDISQQPWLRYRVIFPLPPNRRPPLYPLRRRPYLRTLVSSSLDPNLWIPCLLHALHPRRLFRKPQSFKMSCELPRPLRPFLTFIHRHHLPRSSPPNRCRCRRPGLRRR